MSDYGWFQRVLTIGNTGSDVEIVQRRLKARVTGTYDGPTAALVCGVQNQRSLPVTGIVDSATAGAI